MFCSCHPHKILRLVGKGRGLVYGPLEKLLLIKSFASSSPASSSSTASVTLQFLHDDSVAVVTLHNPRRRNALTASMMVQLDTHVQSLSRWSNNKNETNNNNARAVILTGSGGTFCSGLDLHDNTNNDATTTTTRTTIEDDANSGSIKSSSHILRDGKNMLHHMTRVTNQLLSLPVLSISAVDGYAVGGGAELTTCTDLVVLSRNAKVKFVHAKRGASAGWGGLRRLVKKVGRERALRMLLLGECVLGEEEAMSAARGGGTRSCYADVVATEGETALHATMRAVIDPLLELPCSQSIRAIKRAISYADGDGEIMNNIDGTLKLDTNLALMGERDAFLSVWGGKSNLEQIQKARDSKRKEGTPGKNA